MITIHDISECKEHIPTLAEWHHREWCNLNPARTVSVRETFMLQCAESRGLPLMLVAVDGNNAPAGTAAIIEQDMDTHPELSPWLACVYVAPQYRRRGIGSRLVRAAMAAAAKDFETIYLFTTSQEKLYAGLGWQRIATENYHNHPVVVMRWSRPG